MYRYDVYLVQSVVGICVVVRWFMNEDIVDNEQIPWNTPVVL